MKKYSKKEFKDEEYSNFITTVKSNKNTFKEHLIGSRKKLYVHNHLVATTSKTINLPLGKINAMQFNSFLGMFNKGLYKSFLEDPKLFNMTITFKGVSRAKNLKVWNQMSNGEYFYNVDLNSAYWQIAHKLGYINTKVFEKYLDDDNYKEAKRYCISFLARPNKMVYFKDNETIEIDCNTSVLRLVYDNIRNHLYECISRSINGISNWIEYNIDGVSVMNTDLDLIRERFKRMNLKYKVLECRKISDSQYTSKGLERNYQTTKNK
jgi:hypothetical protein